jgi:signal transduction histidine kinase
MFTFRQKIFLSYLIVFLLFTALLFPVVFHLIASIQETSLKNQTKELIKKVTDADSISDLIEKLEEEEKFLLFRVTLLNHLGETLYDSHRKKAELNFLLEDHLEHPEITEALVNGSGYNVQYSPLFGQDLAYMAVRFTFQNKTYVMRTAFPYGQIKSLINDYNLSFITLSTIILLLFSLMAWAIINFLTRPVRQIIQAITPYQEGRQEHIPTIKLPNDHLTNDEFSTLARTLNSLSKRIEQQINTLIHERNDKEAILESLGEGVVAVDRAMTVVYINKAAEQFLNINKAELIGKNFANTKQSKSHFMLHEAQIKGTTVSAMVKTEGKPKRYLDISAVPKGKNEGAILVVQDETGLYKIIELGRDFIANASHELKTPITIIRGFAETLYDHPELDPEVSKEITEKIVRNCQRMDTLVKNLLTLADVEQELPRSRLEECDLKDLIENCTNMILAVHSTAKITIIEKSPPPLLLMLDSDLFELAIMNLLDNAVKYSKTPAEVTVTLEKKDQQVIISVRDKGLGIPPEDLDHIFERFYTVNKALSRSMGGSGLGLSIVERIVEKHQGRIIAESVLGEGSTFTITLPVLDERY